MDKLASFALSSGTVILGTYLGLTTFFYTVDGGQRGLIFDRFSGVKEKIYGEGMHFYLPIIQVSCSLPSLPSWPKSDCNRKPSPLTLVLRISRLSTSHSVCCTSPSSSTSPKFTSMADYEAGPSA